MSVEYSILHDCRVTEYFFDNSSRRMFLINLFDHKILNLILNTNELKVKNTNFSSDPFISENTYFGNLSPFLSNYKFSGNLNEINLFMKNLVYLPSKNLKSSFKSPKKVKDYISIKIYDSFLELKNLSPIIIINSIIVNVKQKSLKILSTYCDDKFDKNYIRNQIIEIKNNNITDFVFENRNINNKESRNSTKESINNRRELNKNNKILKVSNNIGRERGREEGKRSEEHTSELQSRP